MTCDPDTVILLDDISCDPDTVLLLDGMSCDYNNVSVTAIRYRQVKHANNPIKTQ